MTDPSHEEGTGTSIELVPLLEEVASTLDGVTSTPRDRGFAWAAGGHSIVTVEDGTASFRIGRDIGAAARNTPDASASPMGPEWVAFRPAVLDGHARDRIVAWFGAAHRRADQS
ncbi:MAG: hypothetical protein ABI573_04725 [Chloroflexota bacterium]